MKRAIYLFMMILLLTGCKSSKQATSSKYPSGMEYLSAKMQITAPMQSGTVTLNGTLKLKRSDRVQLSVLMPILRTELVRMEVCPEYCMIVDRMNHQYVTMTKKEMAKSLPSNMTYDRLESLLLNSAVASEKYELSGKDMGLPSLEKAKVVVYDISGDEFEMTPTKVSSRYTQVSSSDMLDKVKALLQ
jgi:uncharacterized protein YceK